MEKFSHEEQLLISKLKLLREGDFEARDIKDLKVRVMREIATSEINSIAKTPRFIFFPRFAPVAAMSGIVFFIFIFVGVPWMALGSMPNDFLYPVKIAREDVALWMARDYTQRTRLQTEFMTERVREARVVANASRDSVMVAEALNRYKANVQRVRQSAVSVEREKAMEVAAKLSASVNALLEEAEKQLAQEPAHFSSEAISQKFVEAAQNSVMVLSEFVEVAEEATIDPAVKVE